MTAPPNAAHLAATARRDWLWAEDRKRREAERVRLKDRAAKSPAYRAVMQEQVDLWGAA